jgi:hypothetical protein
MTPSNAPSREPIDDFMDSMLAPHTPEANVFLVQECEKATDPLNSALGVDYLLEKLKMLKVKEDALPVRNPSVRKMRLCLTTSQMQCEKREVALARLDDTLRLQSDMSQEYYTPSSVVNLVHTLWNDKGIELDPASNKIANEMVKAKRFFSKQDDALTKSWKADTLYLNAPFDRGVCEQFAAKFVEEYKTGEIKEAFILISISYFLSKVFNTVRQVS